MTQHVVVFLRGGNVVTVESPADTVGQSHLAETRKNVHKGAPLLSVNNPGGERVTVLIEPSAVDFYKLA